MPLQLNTRLPEWQQMGNDNDQGFVDAGTGLAAMLKKRMMGGNANAVHGGAEMHPMTDTPMAPHESAPVMAPPGEHGMPLANKPMWGGGGGGMKSL